MRFLSVLFLLWASTAGAQVVGQIMPAPFIAGGLTELKSYLNLNDAQVQSLQTVQQAQLQATQAIYQKMNQKQQQLNTLLESGSGSATEIGQLTLDIAALRKQLPVQGEPYRSQALAVLTPDQKTKLAALVTAMQLWTTASEAANYNLIDRPQPHTLPAVAPVFTPAAVGKWFSPRP